MARSMNEVWDAERRARAVAQKLADLLNEMDLILPGATSIRPGSICGPGVEVRRIGDEFTVR